MKAWINEDLTCGSDLSIANAARRSFDTEHREFQESDARLIYFLIREGHFLPFRHPQLSFSCEAPVFVARQLGKHQVGLSWSEVSRRYKTDRMQFWSPDRLRLAPENAKQGTGAPMHKGASDFLTMVIEDHNQGALELYQQLLQNDVTPEQARAVLPQSMYVYWTWTGSLLAWLHLIRERSHPTAQTETREWVQQFIVPEVAKRFPVTWEAIETHTGVSIPNVQANEEDQVS
jgi:thymidylate synthase (FAD)